MVMIMKNRILLIIVICLICTINVFGFVLYGNSRQDSNENANIGISLIDNFYYSEFYLMTQRIKDNINDSVNLAGDYNTKWNIDEEYYMIDKQSQSNSIVNMLNDGLDYIILELSDIQRRDELDKLFEENGVKAYYLNDIDLKPYYNKQLSLINDYLKDNQVDEVVCISRGNEYFLDNINKINHSKLELIDVSKNPKDLDKYIKSKYIKTSKNTLYVCERSWNVYELIRILNKYKVNSNKIIGFGMNNYIKSSINNESVIDSAEIDYSHILNEFLNDIKGAK